jgi:hypothetical protein
VLACVHGYFLLVHLAALPLSRYSVPFRPLTYLLALFALACAAHWLGPRLGRARAAAGAARRARQAAGCVRLPTGGCVPR